MIVSRTWMLLLRK